VEAGPGLSRFRHRACDRQHHADRHRQRAARSDRPGARLLGCGHRPGQRAAAQGHQ